MCVCTSSYLRAETRIICSRVNGWMAFLDAAAAAAAVGRIGFGLVELYPGLVCGSRWRRGRFWLREWEYVLLGVDG